LEIVPAGDGRRLARLALATLHSFPIRAALAPHGEWRLRKAPSIGFSYSAQHSRSAQLLRAGSCFDEGPSGRWLICFCPELYAADAGVQKLRSQTLLKPCAGASGRKKRA